jgi:hypothetical protein
VKYVAPDGAIGTISPQLEGRGLIYAHPGEIRDVQPWEFIFYPDDGSLPVILATLEGYEAVA